MKMNNISIEADFLIKKFEHDVAKKFILKVKTTDYLNDYFNKNYFGDKESEELTRKEFIAFIQA